MAVRKRKRPAKKRRKAAETEQPRISIQLATKVSDRVQLQDVRLVASECRQTPLVSGKQLEVQLSHEVGVQVSEETGHVAVLPTFRMRAVPVGERSKNIAVQVEALFLVAYTVDDFDGLSQENFNSFAHINGVYNAWPYWREFLQNTIVRMGLPALKIPVFRIASPTRNTQAPKESSSKSSKRKAIRKSR